MADTTKNLGLFKYDPAIDMEETFSIDQALNDNWDIIDESWDILDENFENIATELASKMNTNYSNASYTPAKTDLSNTSPTTSFYNAVKATMISYAMPNYSSASTLSNNSTAPKDGFIRVRGGASNSNGWDTLKIAGVEVYSFKHNDGYAMTCDSIIPICKGQKVVTGGTIDTLKFFPLKGA